MFLSECCQHAGLTLAFAGDEEPSQITSVCCGEEAKLNMERCTNDDELGLRWAGGHGVCTNQTVQLVTTMAGESPRFSLVHIFLVKDNLCA